MPDLLVLPRPLVTVKFLPSPKILATLTGLLDVERKEMVCLC